MIEIVGKIVVYGAGLLLTIYMLLFIVFLIRGYIDWRKTWGNNEIK